MKIALDFVETLNPVRTAVTQMQTKSLARFRAGTKELELTYDTELGTVTCLSYRDGGTSIVPTSNIAFMVPSKVEPKEGKK